MRSLARSFALKALLLVVGGASGFSLASATDVPASRSFDLSGSTAPAVHRNASVARPAGGAERSAPLREAPVLTARAEQALAARKPITDEPFSEPAFQRVGIFDTSAAATAVETVESTVPGPWSAILATFLLTAFFFLRRRR